MNKPKILVIPTSFCRNSAMLQRLGERAELVLNPAGRPLTEEELIPLVGDIDGVLAGLDSITEKVLAHAPRLKVISRYGVGYERVDLEAAGRLGIAVTNTPGANTQSVAELAFALMLAAARKIPALSAELKHGGWSRENGKQLYGKTLGIIGLGAIGKALTLLAKGFGMTVIAYDPFTDEAWARANGVRICTPDELVADADVISLHVPHNDATHHMINRQRLEAMRDGVILINTARGGLIDNDAAAEFVANGKIWGMGLDAFETEPPSPHRLYDFDNVIVTPHSGAHTEEAVRGMAEMSVSNLFGILGNDPAFDQYIVNRQVLVRRNEKGELLS